MTYEAFLDKKPTGGTTLSSNRDWLAYLAGLQETVESFQTGWADHYPASTAAAPVVSTKAFTAQTTTASLTITKPASLAAGDLIVILVATFSNKTANSISGFTLRASTTATDGTDVLKIYLFDKIATGSEPASYTCTMSGSTICQAAAFRITGASASPYQTSGTWNTTALGGYVLDRRLPTVTTTSANNLLIGFHQAWYGTNSNSPSGWTAQYTDQSDTYVYNKAAAAAGATGNTDFNDASTWNLCASIVAAYAPTTPASGYSVLDTSVINASDANNPYSLKVICGTDAAFYGGGKTVTATDWSTAEAGIWVWSDNWSNVTEAHLLLCNDSSAASYYKLDIKPLLSGTTAETWYYVPFDLAACSVTGTPDATAIDYLVCGAKATAATTPTVRFAHITNQPFVNEQLYFSCEALISEPNAMIWGESNWGGTVTSGSSATWSDDFTSAPDNTTWIKSGPISQSGTDVTLGSWSSLMTKGYFDLVGSQVVLKTTSFPSGSGTDCGFMGLFDDGAGFLHIYRTAGAWGVQRQTPDTSYSINNYAVSSDPYWRIKESGGTVTFSRSADGSTWTDVESFSTSDVPRMRFYFMYEDWESSWVIDSITVGTEVAASSYGTGSIWSASPGWVDITGYLTGIETTVGGSSDSRPETGTSKLTFDNTLRKFSTFTSAANAIGGDAGYFVPGTLIRYGVYGTNHWFPRFTGIVRSWVEKTDAVEQYSYVEVEAYQPTGLLARIEQAELGAAVGDGENLSTRIERLLTASGWNYGYENVASTTGTLQATVQSGNRLGECYLTVDSLGATFRSSRRGKALTYEMDTNWLTYDATTNVDDTGSVLPDVETVYLSNQYEAPPSTEPHAVILPYAVDSLSMTVDDANIINEVTGTIVGGTAVTVSDAESIAKYGTRSYKRDDLIAKSTVPLSPILTNYLRLSTYQPESVELHTLMHPLVMAFALMIDVDRLVMVKAQDQVQFRTLIGEYTERIRPRSTEMEWSLSVAFKPYYDSTWWRI